MRRLLTFGILAGALGVLGTAAGQGRDGTPPPDPRDVRLIGNRFPPLAWDRMNAAQRTMVEHLLQGERRGAAGPFNVLLRSPEMGDLAQQFGATMRFRSSLPRPLNEMAILITARHWTSHYEWYAHKRAALDAGLRPAIVEAIAGGARPAAMTPDEAAVYTFCTELLERKRVSDATFAAARTAFGERGVVDLIGVTGYYQLVSMLLNVDEYPLPDGVTPELKPLR
jgi:4-carboxymuconolactone decarboxylase